MFSTKSPPPQTHYMQPADVRAFVVSPQNFSAFIVKAMNKKSDSTTPLKSYQTLPLDRILRQLNSAPIFTKYFVMYFVIIFRLNWFSLQNSPPPPQTVYILYLFSPSYLLKYSIFSCIVSVNLLLVRYKSTTAICKEATSWNENLISRQTSVFCELFHCALMHNVSYLG